MWDNYARPLYKECKTFEAMKMNMKTFYARPIMCKTRWDTTGIAVTAKIMISPLKMDKPHCVNKDNGTLMSLLGIKQCILQRGLSLSLSPVARQNKDSLFEGTFNQQSHETPVNRAQSTYGCMLHLKITKVF